MPEFDAKKNFAYSTILTIPSPAASGTTLSVQTGEGARFPAAPFNVVVWPVGTFPIPSNAEVLRVTSKGSGDNWTVTRAREDSSARTIVAGDQIAQTTTKQMLADIEDATGGGGMVLIAASDSSQSMIDRADYVCDGTADNVQIQEALDAMPGGGHIKLAPGTFNIAAPIVIDIVKGLHFEGSGWTTILKAITGLNDNVFEFDTTNLGIWAKFSNFKVEGNASNQSAGHGIYAPGALECTFDSLWFHQVYNWGIYLYSISESPLDYGHNNHIINCVFDEGDDSPGVGGGVYMEHNDENHIIDCDFQFMGGAGARADALADGYAIFDKAGLNTIVGNAIVNSYNGIMVRDSGNTVISNNIFDRIRFASVMLRGRQNSVRDNIFYQMGANTGLTNNAVGLYIEYYNSQSVDGNWFISDGTNGVTRSFIKDNADATGGGDSSFTNNYFYVDGTLGTGILEQGSSKRNYFANNHGNTVAGSGFADKTTTYTVKAIDKLITCDSTGGAFTVTLPAAAYSYQKITIKLLVDGGDITIARAGSDTIDGATSKTLADAYDSITLQSDGVSKWNVIGSVGL